MNIQNTKLIDNIKKCYTMFLSFFDYTNKHYNYSIIQSIINLNNISQSPQIKFFIRSLLLCSIVSSLCSIHSNSP